MRATLAKFLLAATLTVGVCTALAINWSAPELEAKLFGQVTSAAQAAGISGVEVSVSGRDVSLSGLTTNARAVRKFVVDAHELRGVRSVHSHVAVAPLVQPYPLVIRREGSRLFLSGGIPDVKTRDELAKTTGADVSGLTLLSGYPPLSAWRRAINRGLELSQCLSQGEVRLENLDIAVDGLAVSQEDYKRLLTADGQPTSEGVGTLRVTVAPPLQSPYFWNARYDGSKVIMSGYAPSGDAVNAIKTALPNEVLVQAAVRPASGAPAGFVRHARALVGAFPLVEYGDAHITDASMRFHGAPTSPENAQLLSARLSNLKATWTLDPPRLDQFWLEGEKLAGETRLIGYVPSPETISRYAGLGGVNVRGLLSARGAPAGYADLADLAVASASHLDQGQFRLTANSLTIGGRAATSADYLMLRELPGKASAKGVRVDVAQLSPPVVSPYTFSVQKSADGTVTIKGHVPSGEAQSQLLDEAGERAIDVTNLADGAPAGFLSQARNALTLIGYLKTGGVMFNGETWDVNGTAIDHEKGRKALDFVAQKSLRENGWNVEIKVPEPVIPTADPFVWHVKKADDGTWQLSGFSPSQGLSKFFEVHIGHDVKDETQVAHGAPANFIGNALKTLNALAFLQSGEGGFDGKSWVLTGQPQTRRDAEAVLGIVSSGDTGARGWSVALQSPTVDTSPAESSSDQASSQSVKSAPPAAAADVEAPVAGEVAPQAGPTEHEATQDDAASSGQMGAEQSASDAPTSGEGEEMGAPAASTAETVVPAENGAATEATIEAKPAPTGHAARENSAETVAPQSGSDQAPVTSAYTFLAFKARGEAIALSGNVPSQPARAYIGSLAGNATIENLTIVPDAPAGFVDVSVAGLRALSAMVYGQLSLKDGAWSLSGEAPSEQDAQSLRTMLLGLPGGAGFRVDIKGPPPVEICREKIDAFDERNAILFNPGSDRLTQSSLAAVDELATYLQLCPKAHVDVEGHTDSDGDSASNLALSVARAEAVVDALIARGVQEARLYAIGYGESLPVASNDTVAGKRANRRIVVKVNEKGL